MAQDGSLTGSVALVAGASRGIGADIARYLAAAGVKVAVAARTQAQADPRLPGTIHSVTQEITDAGGEAIPVVLNLRDPEAIAAAGHPGEQCGDLRAGQPGDRAAAAHRPEHAG
jgi:NAD(P)-dependent dehydrogenase (short-subunit alcohol dehydrogenase family)